jgi:hypothetical protein
VTDTAQERRSPQTGDEGLSLGTVVFGLILLAIGIIWLLDVSDVVDVTWTFVGAVMLVLVGIGLIVGARQGSHGGLIFLGIVLSIFVLVGSLTTWPGVGGGVGERTADPQTIGEVGETYNWALGSQTVDLRNVDFPSGETTVNVRLGMGEAVVRVPQNIGVRVEWQIGAGNIEVFDREQSGLGLSDSYQTENFADQETRLILDIQIGMGSVEVTR